MFFAVVVFPDCLGPPINTIFFLRSCATLVSIYRLIYMFFNPLAKKLASYFTLWLKYSLARINANVRIPYRMQGHAPRPALNYFKQRFPLVDTVQVCLENGPDVRTRENIRVVSAHDFTAELV